MLSKQQYLDLNKVNFQSLSTKQKEGRYKNYKLKYQTKNADPNANRNQNKKSKKVKNTDIKSKVTPTNFSKCLQLYARATIDPFDNFQEMPCIPDSICAPSYKYRTFIDTTIVVGTSGVGYAAYNPWNMSISDNANSGTVSDWPLITTTASYPYSSYELSIPVLLAAELTGSNSNSPYTLSSISPGEFRLVAAGMEVEYTGQLMNQSGAISVIQWDGLQPVPAGSTVSQIRANQRTQTCATSREARCYVRYEPTSTQNYDYQNIADVRGSSNPNVPPLNYPLLIIISGATPGTTFRVRCVAFFELQLSNAPVTPSESDAIGFPAFQAARSSVLPSNDPRSDLISILKRTAMNIARNVSGIAPEIGLAIGTALGSPASGRAVGSASKELFEVLFG